MEATREEGGLLERLRPPRIEDAGLEDCALPPESITEAFLKAATAVGSRAASILNTTDDDDVDGTENDCVKDPHPVTEGSSDSMVGIKLYPSHGYCVGEKGGGVSEVFGDEVVTGVTDAEERTDTVVIGKEVTGGEEEGKACVDGLEDLKIGEKVKDDEESRRKEK